MKQLCQNKHTIRFRYWSRKKYAMFYSLGKYVTIGNLKKEIDYRLEEVVFDCDMAICFQPSKEKEIFEVMQEAVGVRKERGCWRGI